MKFCTILVVFAAFAGAAQEATPNPSAALFGKVVNALTHEPVRRACIKIYKAKAQWDEITDGEGRFKFPPLKRAEYGLMVHRDGFTDRTYKVELSDFDDPKELPIEVFPQGVIAGKIVDGFGQSLQGTHVQALHVRPGNQQTEVAGSEETTDLGEYRLAGLDPGVYRVQATYRDGQKHEFDPTPITTARAFYGGSTTPGELTLKPGTVTAGIDFVLNPVRPATVRGVIHTETGEPVNDVSMTTVGPDGEGSGHEHAESGKFEISDVSPGKYTVTARSLENAAPMFGSVTVDVRGEDVSGVELTLHRIGKIDGRIQVEGGNALRPGRMHVFFAPADGLLISSMAFAEPDAAGVFVVGLNPGEYTVTVQSLPDNLVLEKLTLDGVPVSNWKINMDSTTQAKKLVVVLAPKKEP